MPFKRLLGTLLVLGLLGLSFVLVVAVRAKDAPRFTARVAGGGRPVPPDLVLDRLDAPGSGRISDYRGKVAIVNFYASWCAPCKDEAPALAALAARFHGDPAVVMVGIDNEDARAAGLAFAQANGLDYDLYHARGQEARTPWGVTGYPETFVLDRSGRAVAWFSGPVEQSALLDAVARAQAA